MRRYVHRGSHPPPSAVQWLRARELMQRACRARVAGAAFAVANV